MHPPNKAIYKYIVCFEQHFCSGSIWLTRIIKNLNKNHCLLPLDSIQVVTDSLEGWQEARYTVLGDIQTSMKGPVCHLPPPLMLESQANHVILLEKYLYKARRWDSAAGLNFQNCRKPHREKASFQKHLEWPPASQVQRCLSVLHIPSRVKSPSSVFSFPTQWGEKLKPFKLECACSPCRVLEDIMR